MHELGYESLFYVDDLLADAMACLPTGTNGTT